MRIYTKFGDDGNTQLLGGQQTRKSDLRLAVCGTLDELSAVLGLAAASDPPAAVGDQIQMIQSDLLSMGSRIAAMGAETKMELPQLTTTDVERLENEIDAMNSGLTELRNFLLPGGHAAAATLHVARAVCRRAEREMVALVDQYPEADAGTPLAWLNRLGDWCFVAARRVNHAHDITEPLWRPAEPET